MSYKLLLGDCLETLKTIPDGTVQCCVTSPPYYGLRDYGVDGQIGLEGTPEGYVQNLVDVFFQVRRVLKDDGTLWLNLGDSYAGSGGPGSQYDSKSSKSFKGEFKKYNNPNRKIDNLKPKDLIGIPWMVAFALRSDGWWLRQDIIWAKPNPMPESVTDRCTKSHEYIFLLSKSPHYFCDMEAIKEDGVSNRPDMATKGIRTGLAYLQQEKHANNSKYSFARKVNEEPPPGKSNQHREDREDIEYFGTRNKRDVWTVTTKPFRGAHFATFPPDLIEPCILAGSKVGDTVLDPFNGAGTTGLVSIKHNRDYVGLELNPDYIKITEERLKEVQPTLTLINEEA